MLQGRVLITGYTGFVGSHMADYLLAEHDCEVVGATRWRSDRQNVKHLENNERVTTCELDLLDPASLNQALKVHEPDYIIHFAAQSSPQSSFKVPVQTLRTNIEGSVNLYEAIRNHGKKSVRTVIVSSSEVYGNPLPEEVPIKETNPIRAANPYSISKVGADFMAQYYQKAYDLDLIITRMFSHEGARRGLDFALSSFAHQIVLAEEAEELQLYAKHPIRVGNLDSVRSYIHISDAVRAYALALETGVRGEIYNIGGNSTFTIREALDKLLSASTLSRDRFRIEVCRELLRPTDITLQIPDCTKFRTHTGWEPTTGLDEIVQDLLNYWRIRILL